MPAYLLTSRLSSVAGLIAQQFLQLIPSGSFTRIGIIFRDENAPGKIEIFTEVARRFLKDRLGSAIPALVGSPQIIAHAIQADAEIGAAMVARFTTTGQSWQAPLPAAFMAMACHGSENVAVF
jgi:hypothetical protein